MKQIKISEELYDELVEYFDNRSDADYDAERYIPNKEMFLLNWLRVAWIDSREWKEEPPTLGCGELKNYNSGI